MSKNYVEKPTEDKLTEEDKRVIKFFDDPIQKLKAKEIVKIWYENRKETENQIIDYTIANETTEKDAKRLLSIYLFLNHYTQEITEGTNIHNPNDLELTLIKIVNEELIKLQEKDGTIKKHA